MPELYITVNHLYIMYILDVIIQYTLDIFFIPNALENQLVLH